MSALIVGSSWMTVCRRVTDWEVTVRTTATIVGNFLGTVVIVSFIIVRKSLSVDSWLSRQSVVKIVILMISANVATRCVKWLKCRASGAESRRAFRMSSLTWFILSLLFAVIIIFCFELSATDALSQVTYSWLVRVVPGLIGLMRPLMGVDLLARVVLLTCRPWIVIRCILVGIWSFILSRIMLLGIRLIVLTLRCLSFCTISVWEASTLWIVVSVLLVPFLRMNLTMVPTIMMLKTMVVLMQRVSSRAMFFVMSRIMTRGPANREFNWCRCD